PSMVGGGTYYAAYVRADGSGDPVGPSDPVVVDEYPLGASGPVMFEGTSFSSTNGDPVAFTTPGSDAGYIFDIFELDNSFKLKINGEWISNEEIEFQSNANALGANVKFADEEYEDN